MMGMNQFIAKILSLLMRIKNLQTTMLVQKMQLSTFRANFKVEETYKLQKNYRNSPKDMNLVVVLDKGITINSKA